jgi:hypothetical protein
VGVTRENECEVDGRRGSIANPDLKVKFAEGIEDLAKFRAIPSVYEAFNARRRLEPTEVGRRRSVSCQLLPIQPQVASVAIKGVHSKLRLCLPI